ncbi:T9SS type A sorting domain-containing protein [Polaribacter sp.]|nr:T9SS type A sorting domain-containing protein [Polaribacter sp.]
MKKVIPFIVSSLFTVSVVFAQQTTAAKAVLLKSTITNVGAVTSLVIAEEKYKVIQSIGQNGIVGRVELNNKDVQQGFLTNTRYFSVRNSDNVNFKETFPIVISPNPFVDYIKIDFSIKTQHPIHLKIYDINGKIYKNEMFEATKSITVPMKNVSIGTYLVKIVSGENKYVEKIFKGQ